MKILLLEDNAMLRSMVTASFSRRGWEVVSYPDPMACPLYIAARCTCPEPEACADVIVTDFEMPHTNGVEFVKALTAKGCHIKHVAIFSDSTEPASQKLLQESGFKVFSKSEGLGLLLKWLEEIQAQQGSRAAPHQSSLGSGK